MENQPKSLPIFFTTEMWERYGFYAVQSLLALYLAMHYHWPDKKIYTLVGSFTALTYLSPLVGGWVADKLIGQKRAILLGAMLLFVSYCLLSMFDSSHAMIYALAGIAVGTGLLKPNISSLLGNEYLAGSVKRESGFTIFYMGITTGIILGTTIPTELSVHLGWPASFISAAFGMIMALLVFGYGIYKYNLKDYNLYVYDFWKTLLSIILLVLLWSLSFFILKYAGLANLMFALVVLFSAIYLIYSVTIETAQQARQTLIIGLLCIISVIFWAFYFQVFMSWTLFISRAVQPTFCGIQFPPPYYVTIQSIGMLIIGYFIAKKRTKNIFIDQGLDTGKKFLLAMLLMTASYFTLVFANWYALDTPTLLSPLLIIPAYLILSWGELLLSPVGLAAITVLACKQKVSTMMGIFLVSLGLGGFLSGKLSTLTAIPKGERHILVLKSLYAKAFTLQLEILVIAGMACLVIFALIKYLVTYAPAKN
ncbi:MAG: MFS transporter [Legionella sp.]|nr:MFS transporter [Legionella sp.]